MSEIRFTVIGEARPAGSKRAFALRKGGQLMTRPSGHPVIVVTDDNKEARGWKRAVAETAQEALSKMGGRVELLRGALAVCFTFYRPRPKGHMARSGLSKAGREMPHPISRPDVLKLARAAEDALTGVIWGDDAQIVDEQLAKRWGEPARLEVVIRVAEIPPQ